MNTAKLPLITIGLSLLALIVSGVVACSGEDQITKCFNTASGVVCSTAAASELYDGEVDVDGDGQPDEFICADSDDVDDDSDFDSDDDSDSESDGVIQQALEGDDDEADDDATEADDDDSWGAESEADDDSDSDTDSDDDSDSDDDGIPDDIDCDETDADGRPPVGGQVGGEGGPQSVQ